MQQPCRRKQKTLIAIWNRKNDLLIITVWRYDQILIRSAGGLLSSLVKEKGGGVDKEA